MKYESAQQHQPMKVKADNYLSNWNGFESVLLKRTSK